MWNYRLVYDGKKAFVAEVFYNEDGSPELHTNGIKLEGYDWENPDINDKEECVKDLRIMLKMILNDLDKYPTVLRSGVDFVTKEYIKEELIEVDVEDLDGLFDRLKGDNDE